MDGRHCQGILVKPGIRAFLLSSPRDLCCLSGLKQCLSGILGSDDLLLGQWLPAGRFGCRCFVLDCCL